ncbi:MAG: hypothetical protein U0169_27335 [Polyangiaceae bacterium]
MRTRLLSLASLSLVTACVGLQLQGCSSDATPDSPVADPSTTSAASVGCIHEDPIAEDGYTEFAKVDASKVTRKRLDATGALIDDPEKLSTPSDEDLGRAMKKIAAYTSRINAEIPASARRRERYSAAHRGEAFEPYCLFHKAGQATYGTVVLFHGFNDRPYQQAKLASYLFHAGFNVYNAFLATMTTNEGTKSWPKTTYRPEVLATVQGKLQNPANVATLQPILPRIQSGALTDQDLLAIDGVLAPELSIANLKNAWTHPGGDDFKKLFNFHEPKANESLYDTAKQADFLQYVRDAKERLDDLADIPGPMFVGGLSVGGALAVALAETDGGRRVRGVMSHAPWFQSLEPKNNLQIMLGGPLDENATMIGAPYPIVWENHQIPMSPANIAANLALGAWSAMPANVATLARIPTAFITTDAEDSADNVATGKLLGALQSDPRVAALHVAANYPANLNVGHALTDPENYTADKWNHFYRTLYQESFRFYTTGTVSQKNLVSKAQDDALPKASCVLADFPGRCNE